MKIDWKKVCKSPGYISLKAAYIKSVQESEAYKIKFNRKPMSDKAEFLKHFNWVINRAKHFSIRTGGSIESWLEIWEKDRNYYWLNYYQNCNQPKYHSNSLNLAGDNAKIKYVKHAHFYTQDTRAKRLAIQRIINKPNKEKNRWPMRRKRHYKKSL